MIRLSLTDGYNYDRFINEDGTSHVLGNVHILRTLEL